MNTKRKQVLATLVEDGDREAVEDLLVEEQRSYKKYLRQDNEDYAKDSLRWQGMIEAWLDDGTPIPDLQPEVKPKAKPAPAVEPSPAEAKAAALREHLAEKSHGHRKRINFYPGPYTVLSTVSVTDPDFHEKRMERYDKWRKENKRDHGWTDEELDEYARESKIGPYYEED